MSNRHFPYASPDEIDYAREAQVRRAERAFKALSVSDVLAQVDDLLSQEPDERNHAFFHFVEFLLDRSPACDGGQLYDSLRALVLTAINRCLEAALQGEVRP